MVSRRTIRISRDIERHPGSALVGERGTHRWARSAHRLGRCGFANGAHLARELCERLPQAAHRDRLDDARFRDLAAPSGLAMRPDTAVAVGRVAHYGKRLFAQLTVIPTHRQPIDGIV